MHLLLTDRFCDRAKCEVQTDYFDETVSGLALRVSKHGVKAWTFLYTAGGKRRRITLGRYPAISLANARTLALEARSTVAAGLDPRPKASMNVADLVEAYIVKHTVGLRSGDEIARRLRKNIVSVIGTVPLAELHRRDATRVVDAIAGRGAPIEASRTFQDLRSMLRWALARGDIDADPIAGMSAPPGGKPRERVLSDDELRTLWTRLPTALSLECQRIIRLCLLTAQRVGEVAGMTRGEIDFDQRVWRLPGTRTKNGHAHVVPMGPDALAVIQECPSGDRLLHASPMTVARTIIRAQERFGLAHWTAHDLRRTALTGMAKLGIPPLVLGHIANHRTTTKAGMTLSVYVHHAYEREKREALELWADRLRGIIGGAEVVPLHRARGEDAPDRGRKP
jgi:integrase